MSNEEQRITREETLGEFLRGEFPESSGRTRKQMLEAGRVRVNGAVVRVASTRLRRGDRVEVVGRSAAVPRPEPILGLTILHLDPDLVVIDKSAGLLTIATAKEREKTAYRQLSAYVKTLDPRNKIFIVHRLDRLASGVLVFARSPEVKQVLQDQLRAHTMERVYLAVCEGRPKEREGKIDTRLVEAKTGRVHESPHGPGSVAAVTHWKVLRSGGRFSLLEVRLETGRKHQIRVHLAGMNHPIAGDPVYGSRFDPLRRLALHAASLAFDHPRTGERVRFDSPAPWSTRKLGMGGPPPVVKRVRAAKADEHTKTAAP